MSKETDANSRERTLGENIIILSIVAILMGAFIFYFFKQEQRFTEAGFKSIASKFSLKVTAIRAQWFMDNQPDAVLVKEAGVKQLISVNKNGWVDFTNESESCQKIWFAVIGNKLEFMNQPVTVMEIFDRKTRQLTTCRYSLVRGEYFDYLLTSGKVGIFEEKQHSNL